MIKFKVLLFFVIMILSPLTIFSTNDNFNFLNFYVDETLQTNKVSYEVISSNEFKDGDKFVLEIYYKKKLNDKKELIDDSCTKKLDTSSQTIFTKYVCDVKKMGDGEYTFIGKIIRENKSIKIDLTKQYISKKNKIKMSSKIIGNKTIIFIDILGTGKDIVIENEIPKSVIKSLTNENENELIETKFKYEIINEDPLIAWSVEKAPTRINYTINKKISQKDLSDFGVSLQSENKYLKYSNYFLIIVILFIIFLVFKPIFLKNKNNKK